QDKDYYNAEVAPHVDNQNVFYLGSVGPAQRQQLLGQAYALLHPIHFDEPFGLSVVESMACGTPVIAFRRGSMPEVINDGHTGFLVNNIDEACKKLNLIRELDRKECYRWVKERFSQERMVDDYIALYKQILSR
ncbi:MAG TPA: glycosyl transferase, partial [Syntrophomonas sp.]|nr:glycosyl transferase [Syntrophomonas sp.]